MLGQLGSAVYENDQLRGCDAGVKDEECFWRFCWPICDDEDTCYAPCRGRVHHQEPESRKKHTPYLTCETGDREHTEYDGLPSKIALPDKVDSL